MSENETVADIIVEMRHGLDKSWHEIDREWAHDLADRLEAAWKREIVSRRSIKIPIEIMPINEPAMRNVVSKWATFPVPTSADAVEPEFLLSMLEEVRDDMRAVDAAWNRMAGC